MIRCIALMQIMKCSDYLLVVALGDETGRLLRYSRRARRVEVLRSGLSYPNGVALLR